MRFRPTEFAFHLRLAPANSDPQPVVFIELDPVRQVLSYRGRRLTGEATPTQHDWDLFGSVCECVDIRHWEAERTFLGRHPFHGFSVHWKTGDQHFSHYEEQYVAPGLAFVCQALNCVVGGALLDDLGLKPDSPSEILRRAEALEQIRQQPTLPAIEHVLGAPLVDGGAIELIADQLPRFGAEALKACRA